MSKITIEEREIVIKQIIKKLLEEPKNNYSANKIKIRDAGYISAGRIMEELKVSQDVVDYAINLCFKNIKNEKAGRRFCFAKESLSAAAYYLSFGGSKKIAEKVILEIARFGRHERIEYMTDKYLGRNPSKKEARLLISAYLEDVSWRSEHAEQTLIRIAEKCLPNKEVAQIKDELVLFVEKFDNYLD